MRVKLALGASVVLLAACRPPQDDSKSSAIVPNQSPASTSTLLPTHDTNRIEHFWFSYPFPPQPGSRVWINVGQTNWVEVYPDGSQSRYLLLHRETVDGLAGIVVFKTAGDLETSQTLNNGSFQAFLPDKDSARRVLYFRNRIDGQWQPWRPLANINPIE